MHPTAVVHCMQTEGHYVLFNLIHSVCMGLISKIERIVHVCVGETGSMRYQIYNLDRLF
jgi:hypothetical protein